MQVAELVVAAGGGVGRLGGRRLQAARQVLGRSRRLIPVRLCLPGRVFGPLPRRSIRGSLCLRRVPPVMRSGSETARI